MKQSFAILDFGTSKITVLIGGRGINDTINIEGIGVCEYAGYVCGAWRERERLTHCICQAIQAARARARIKIDKVYVGVPNEFSDCKVSDVNISLNKNRRVTERDVAALREAGNSYGNNPDWTVVNMQPIYYTLDNEHKLIEPIGMFSTKLGGSISYILARNGFISDVRAALAAAEIFDAEFLSASLAELILLFDDYRRDKCVILADVGALGTALTVGRGDGVCAQNYFAWGGLRITDALSAKFGISLKQAEQLKRKVILSLEPDYVLPEKDDIELANKYDVPLSHAEQQKHKGEEIKPEEESPEEKAASLIVQTEYEIEADNTVKTFGVADVNRVVRIEIDKLAQYIQKALGKCGYEFPPYTPISVTGGGLAPIRGAIEYLAECLSHEVEAVKPVQPMLDSVQLASALGILNMVLLCNSASGRITDRFKRWVSKRKHKE